MFNSRRDKLNRRMQRRYVLDVRLRTRETRAARLRVVSVALALAVSAGALFFAVWRGSQWAMDRFLLKNPAFVIRHLEIDTGNRLPAELVRDWSGIHQGQNLIDLDLERVKRDLELVSLLGSVTLQRVPPGTLRIRVRPRLPVVEIQMPELQPEGGMRWTRFYLDAEGYVIRFPTSHEAILREHLVPSALPRLTGLPVHCLVPGLKPRVQNLGMALALAAAFEDSPMSGLAELTVLDLSRPEVVEAWTAQGNRVTFGLQDPLRQLARWRGVHDHAASQGQMIRTLDLSPTNNVPAVLQDRETAHRPTFPGGDPATRRRANA